MTRFSCAVLALALAACGGGGSNGSASSGGSSGSSGTSGTSGGGSSGTSGTSGTSGGSSGSSGTSGTSGGSSSGGVGGDGSAKAVAAALGKSHFLFCAGADDNDEVLSLGQPIDLRYEYLVKENGVDWTTFNPNGTYVTQAAQAAVAKSIVPMFTFYELAGMGDGNVSVLADQTYMTGFWSDVKLMATQLGQLSGPSVVHFEPDFWGYLEGSTSGDPTKQAAKVTISPDCGDLPNNANGAARCMLRMVRKYAPKAIVGLHASDFGAGDGTTIGAFMAALTAPDKADFVGVDILDRDAGCYETQGPDCSRSGSGWYWADKDFTDHFAWVKQIHDASKLAVMEWQTPLGVASSSPGGTTNHYRDNRVQYMFAHVDQMVAAGEVGACFGPGASSQTTLSTDGGQLKSALAGYYANPFKLE